MLKKPRRFDLRMTGSAPSAVRHHYCQSEPEAARFRRDHNDNGYVGMREGDKGRFHRWKDEHDVATGVKMEALEGLLRRILFNQVKYPLCA
jgi:hypothetical protein